MGILVGIRREVRREQELNKGAAGDNRVLRV